MRTKIRVHFHIPEPDVGGAEVHALNLWKTIDRSRFELSVSAPPMRAEFRWFEEEIRKLTPLHLFSRSPSEIARFLDSVRPDLVQFYNSTDFNEALDGVNFPFSGIELIHAKKFWGQDITKTPKHHVRIIIGVSDDACRFYDEHRTEREIEVRTIWNGINCARFPDRSRIHSNPLRFLSVSRLSIEDKRLDDLIYYFHRLGTDSHELVLVGEGPDEGVLREFAESLGAKNIRFAGFLTDPVAAYSEADVYLSLSEREGYGLSLAEAAASGLPIISWKCGGIMDLFENGKNALILENDGEILPALARLTHDSGLRESLGRNARSLALSKFDLGGMTRSYERLYEELLTPDSRS
jgi:glycosyltransferase involved in cell wall biosynthesis